MRSHRSFRWLQASYTIEAALLLPLFLTALTTGILLAVDCYEDVVEAASDWELLREIEPTTQIWRTEAIRQGMEELFGDTVSEKSEE